MKSNAREYLIVPSGGISTKGTLPFYMKRRLQLSYAMMHAIGIQKIVVSGKWSYRLDDTPPPLTEALAMKQYLLTLDCPAKDIIMDETSCDLISAACAIKAHILIPRRIHHVFIVTHKIEAERTRYVFGKVLGPDFHIRIKELPDMLSPDVLWAFYRYEQRALAATKNELTKIRRGNDKTITRLVGAVPMYRDHLIGETRLLAYQNRVGRTSNILPHYSLTTIRKAKTHIFHTYGLTEKRRKSSLNADFWSGRFLSFIGRDELNQYYCLKFALRYKDRASFQREILLSERMQKSFSFVPTVVDKHVDTSPVWYLYRIVSGKTAGKFSVNFSFDQTFYKSFVIEQLVSHLAELRAMDIHQLRPKVWNARQYLRQIQAKAKLHTSSSLFQQKYVKETIELLSTHAQLFDTMRLYPSHSDLHPGNIIISQKNKRVYFIDFEHTSLNNIAFDICFLYLFSWDNPQFQKRLLHAFRSSLTDRERIEFDEVFPWTYRFFLIWFLDCVARWKDRASKERYLATKAYIIDQLRHLLSSNAV